MGGVTIHYSYDAAGNRVVKEVSGAPGGNSRQFYIRDAQGNTLALYRDRTTYLEWSEQHLYGSSRLGIWHYGKAVPAAPAAVLQDSGLIGSTAYELTNHLGNVLSSISDKKIGVSSNSSTVDYYAAEVLSQNDYYPFGMGMPGRKFSNGLLYRYGFNGKENDNEVKGEGNQQDYGMRIYDPRLGKFLSVDPLTNKYPELSPYQFASNMPIIAVDLDGEEAKVVTIYHSFRDYSEFYRTVQNNSSVFSSIVSNSIVTIHKYPFNTPMGIEYRQVGPADLSFDNPVNFQTGRIDLTSQTLGLLSEKYESAGVGTVSSGKGDHGGVSYGSWQLATNMGSPQEFLENEGSVYKNDFGDAQPGSKKFSKIWKGIAGREPEAFKAAQHAFIKRRDYDRMVGNVLQTTGIDLNSKSSVLQDVVWSTAVQHGGASNIINIALQGKDVSKISDADIIKLIYAERGRKDSNGNLVHFSSSSKAVQRSVSARYVNEENEALKKLNN